MGCPKSLDSPGRLIDGELPPLERDALEKHIRECDGCHAAYAELCAADAALLRAFMPRRRAASALANRVIVQVRGHPDERRLPSWATSLGAAAAGFLLAVVLLQPPILWQEQKPSLPVARLAVPTGPLEIGTTRLAQIDHAQLSRLSEEKIRSLGCEVAVPLLQYVKSSRSCDDERARVAAARIAADLATETAIGDLIALLADSNPQVRFHAARALKRHAGRDLGVPEPTREAWQQWWKLRRLSPRRTRRRAAAL